MEKLSDVEIRNIAADDGEKYWASERRMATEIRDLRAQRAASRERVREVVMAVASDILEHPESKVLRAFDVADAIAERTADTLASPQPTLDAARVREVVLGAFDEIDSQPGRTSRLPGRDAIAARVAEQLAGQADPDPRRGTPSPERAEVDRVARILLAEWERVEGKQVNVSYIATFADMARAVIADRGQAVALSAEDREVLASVRAWLSPGVHTAGCALLDRLLSTPGQGASPAEVPQPDPRDAAILALQNGTTLAEVAAALLDADRESRSTAQPSEHPASAVDPALCRRLAAESTKMSIARQLTAAADLAERYAALERFCEADKSLELAEHHEESINRIADALGDESEWSNCCDRGEVALELVGQLKAERDAARAECERMRGIVDGSSAAGERCVSAYADQRRQLDDAQAEIERLRAAIESAGNDRLRAEMQCGAAKEECERLQAALDKRPLRTFDQLAADRLADEVAVLVRRKVIDARSPAGDALLDYRDPPPSPRADRLATLEAEFVALRRALWARLEERHAMTSRIYDLLATEPAVSEERCAEPWQVTRDPHDFLAAARQLHALRAGLREIVGGEPSPRAWSVTPERVEALKHAVDLLSASVRNSTIAESRALAAMLAEVSP